MQAVDVQHALVTDLEETGLPWLCEALRHARPELLEDALFLVYDEADRYAFWGARMGRTEVHAALRAVAPGLGLRIHRAAEEELYGL